MDSLKAKVSSPVYMMDSRGLVKLSRFSGENLDISSWWSRLTEKLAVSGIMGLVADMATDAKRAMRPNTFGVPLSLLYLSWTLLICLNSEVQRFTYSRIRRRTVKAHRDLIHLLKTALIRLG